MAYEGYEKLDPERHRDLVGRGKAPWGRRVLLAVLTAVIVLALANVFGQRTTNSSAHGTAGKLVVTAPGALRAGDMFPIWFSFQANRTTAGERRIDTELVDGATPVATVRRTIRVFPPAWARRSTASRWCSSRAAARSTATSGGRLAVLETNGQISFLEAKS